MDEPFLFGYVRNTKDKIWRFSERNQMIEGHINVNERYSKVYHNILINAYWPNKILIYQLLSNYIIIAVNSDYEVLKLINKF